MLVNRQSSQTSESTAIVRGMGESEAGLLLGGIIFDHAPRPSDDSSASRVVHLISRWACSRFSNALLAYIAAPVTYGINLLICVSAFSSFSSNVVMGVGFVSVGFVDVAKSKGDHPIPVLLNSLLSLVYELGVGTGQRRAEEGVEREV